MQWKSDRKRAGLGATLTVVLALSGCGFVPIRTAPAVPPQVIDAASPAGYHKIRTFDDGRGARDGAPDDLDRAAMARMTSNRTFDLLALSGGGDAGAFGAGVLNGWTQRGDRPQFDYVTGVSTGALIAPMAFLGPRYDAALRSFYTETTSTDIILLRPLKVLSGSSAVGDSTPLKRQIEGVVTPQMVDEIAAERRKGRMLLIGTSNLDAQQQVVWDIGRIAASNQPDRVQLIHKILLASASIPGAFPPVAIDVTADGRRYQELHVDGGVTRGVFAYSNSVKLPPSKSTRRMWVIRNSKMAPEPQATRQGLVSIATRSLSTLIKGQALSNVEDMQRQAARDGFAFNVTAVPSSLLTTEARAFDQQHMRTLYSAGVQMGRSPRGWAPTLEPLLVPSPVLPDPATTVNARSVRAVAQN